MIVVVEGVRDVVQAAVPQVDAVRAVLLVCEKRRRCGHGEAGCVVDGDVACMWWVICGGLKVGRAHEWLTWVRRGDF